MSEKRILCVGMCVLDVIHVCAEYPREDTDKRCLDGYWQRGGNASNNSSVLTKLGANCEFLGVTSASPAFAFLYDDCKQNNIEISNCPKTEMNPPFSSIILVQSKGSRTIVHSNPGFPILTYEHFRKIDLKSYSWIHFEGRNPEETQQMMDMIRDYNKTQDDEINKIKISVELEKLNKDLFTLAVRSDLVFIGKDMAEYMLWFSAREAVNGANHIIKEIQRRESKNLFTMPVIICPWGSKCTDCYYHPNKEYHSLKAVQVDNVIDSLGAGDTFVAAVIYAMNNLKMKFSEAVDYGNRVAAFKIQHRGYDCVENFRL